MKYTETEIEEIEGSYAKSDQTTRKKAELKESGATVVGNKVLLYRGGNVSKKTLKKLRYGDYLSTVKEGLDSSGNEGASGYGKNVVRFELPIDDVEVVNGEIQYKGKSESINSSGKYPERVYKAFNDYYGSNYISEEIDKEDPQRVRRIASMALPGGKVEFDQITKNQWEDCAHYKYKED